MTDEFITQALQQDRYLKAIELINRFETEIEHLQKHAGKRIIEENRGLFVRDATASYKSRRDSSNTLAFARTDFKMSRFTSEGPESDRLKMSLMIHWNDPSILGHNEVEGALAVASLRIKNLHRDEFQSVRNATLEEGWKGIQFGEDPFGNSPGILYSPVETKQDIDRAYEQLAAHFQEYGENYGTPRPVETGD